MNQILSMDRENPGGQFGGQGQYKKSLDIKTVVIIFVVAAIVFGLVMLGNGVYGVVQLFNKPTGPAIQWPQIVTEQDQNTLILTVSNDVAIDQIQYSWNSGRVNTVLGNGQTTIYEEIEIPVGDNSFELTVLDINGKTEKYTEQFTGVELEDTTKPVVDLSLEGAGKLNISAKAPTETKLSYLTYKWDDDTAETRIDAQGDQKTIETQIAIKQGEHELTIVVVNEKNISTTVKQKFDGRVKPNIKVEQNEDILTVEITHENGVKSADIVFNAKNVVLTPDHFGGTTVTFTLTLKEGTNNVYIKAYSLDETTEEFQGVAQYKR